MYVIIGGAYQGKLEYAKAQYEISDKDVFECTADEKPDFTKRCLYRIENYALFCVKTGLDPISEMGEWLERVDSVLICEDIFCGVVPVDEDMRACRELAGRLLGSAVRKAEGAVRIFCGLPQVLK